MMQNNGLHFTVVYLGDGLLLFELLNAG